MSTVFPAPEEIDGVLLALEAQAAMEDVHAEQRKVIARLLDGWWHPLAWLGIFAGWLGTLWGICELALWLGRML